MAAAAAPSMIVNELLNQDNYKHWRVRVRTYLVAKGLWNLVDGTTKRPRGEATLEAWSKMNAEALHAIHICCGNDAFSLIEEIDSAKHAWKTLAKNLRKNGDYDTSSDGDTKTEEKLETEDVETEKEPKREVVKDSSSMAAPVVPSSIVNEPLNRYNYEDWRFRVQTYLVAKGLWSVVDHNTERFPKCKDKREAWEKINAEALHAIHICCGNDAFTAIRGEYSASRAWNALAEYPGNIQSNEEKEADVPKVEMDKGNGDGDKNSANDNTDYEPFFDDAKHLKWDFVMDFIKKHPEAIRKTAPSDHGKTVLHYAVDALRVDIVKMLSYIIMTDDDLEITDNDCRSALDYCFVLPENDEIVEIAKCLIQRKGELTAGCVDPTLLVRACTKGRLKLAAFLYKVTPLGSDDRHAAQLISLSFSTMRFDIACDLIQRYPRLGLTEDFSDSSPLNELARTPSAFLSGCRLQFWKKWIYHVIYIKPSPTIKSKEGSTLTMDNEEKSTPTGHVISMNDIPIQEEKTQKSGLIRSVMAFIQRSIIDNLGKIFGINRIYQMKLNHVRSLEILSCICKAMTREEMKYLDDKQRTFVETAIYQAIERGLVEFITHIFGVYPNLIKISDENGRNLLQVAVKYREEEIFNLIHGCTTRKTQKYLMSMTDGDGNNMLHMVAILFPLSKVGRIRGPALQMQKELQWLQATRSIDIITPEDYEAINDTDRMKPLELFTENHKELMKEGERSMKDTATSCTVVGALIVTMMFAAAFTVPGGNNGDTGVPILLDRKAFKIFIVADAISLFSSTTSVMLFSGVLTSRYAEKDFLKSLPRKMILGLSTLFLSVVAMMIAFSSALFLMLPGQPWIAVPAAILSSVPIASFVLMQFPFLVEIYNSTYRPIIFKGNVPRWEIN